jgi:hypothetical protein
MSKSIKLNTRTPRGNKDDAGEAAVEDKITSLSAQNKVGAQFAREHEAVRKMGEYMASLNGGKGLNKTKDYVEVLEWQDPDVVAALEAAGLQGAAVLSYEQYRAYNLGLVDAMKNLQHQFASSKREKKDPQDLGGSYAPVLVNDALMEIFNALLKDKTNGAAYSAGLVSLTKQNILPRTSALSLLRLCAEQEDLYMPGFKKMIKLNSRWTRALQKPAVKTLVNGQRQFTTGVSTLQDLRAEFDAKPDQVNGESNPKKFIPHVLQPKTKTQARKVELLDDFSEEMFSTNNLMKIVADNVWTLSDLEANPKLAPAALQYMQSDDGRAEIYETYEYVKAMKQAAGDEEEE